MKTVLSETKVRTSPRRLKSVKPVRRSAPGARITVVIPVLNESRTVANVVKFALRDPRVGEVLVIDDGSIDGTNELAEGAGAKVVTSSLLGKGASMEDGLQAARHDLILYLDGDLRGLRRDLVQRMTQPLVDDQADFVKARFARSGGRVTVLTARPLLRTYFPELADFAQPLGGIIAVRRTLLQQLRFENDYGVDVGLLIDAAAARARIVEVDIGHIKHDSQSLEALGEMATQVARTILERAGEWGRLRVSHVRAAKAGYLVGVVTDSYRMAAETVRRRVFADFTISHVMKFRREKATGRITLAPAMKHPQGCREHRLCKLNVLRHLVQEVGIGSEQVLAVGDSDNDVCLLRAAGVSVAFQPKTPAVRDAARHVIEDDLRGILPLLGLPVPKRAEIRTVTTGEPDAGGR